MVIIAVILLVIAKVLKSYDKFTVILISIFSLETISIIFLLLHLVLFNIVGQIKYIDFINLLWGLCQIFYLFFIIRIIFSVSSLKALLIQIISLLFLFIITFFLVFISGRFFYEKEVNKAFQYMHKYEFANAINKFTALVDINPNNARYRHYLGKAYSNFLIANPRYFLDDNIKEKNKIFEKAEKAYLESLSLDQNLLDSIIGLGSLYHLMREYEKGLEQFKIAIDSGIKEKEVYREIAEIYLKLKKPELAQKYYNYLSNKDKKKFNTDSLFYMEFKDDLNIIQGNYSKIEVSLTWRIVDEALFDLSVGNKERAEEMIEDYFYLIIRRKMAIECNISFEDLVTKKSVKREIIPGINESIKEENLGIEIMSLSVKK